MANSNSGVVGAIVGIAIIGGLTYWNHHRGKERFYENCMSGRGAVPELTANRLCECGSEKLAEYVGYVQFIPVVGRFFAPDEEKLASYEDRAGQSCASEMF